MILTAFGLLGKTYFANKYPDLAKDLKSTPFKYMGDNSINPEADKGNPDRIINDDFPINYVNKIEEVAKLMPFTFIAFNPQALDELERRGVSYDILWPRYSRKEKIINEAEERGNTSDFIKFLEGLMISEEEFNSLISNRKHNNLYIINDNEYIEDVLKREFPKYFNI